MVLEQRTRLNWPRCKQRLTSARCTQCAPQFAGSWQLVAGRSSFGTLSGAIAANKADLAEVQTAADFRKILDREWPQLPDDLRDPIAEQAAVRILVHLSACEITHAVLVCMHVLPDIAQVATMCSQYHTCMAGTYGC